MTLHCAMGQPEEQWLPLSAHEFAHFTQWNEQCEAWMNYVIEVKFNNNIHDVGDIMWHWVNGEEVSEELLDASITASREVELDCERRTLKLIEKFGLPIDSEDYAQKANAYVHFYNSIRSERQWYEIDKEPYNTKEVVELMPFDLDRDYSTSPENVQLAIKKYCLDRE